MIPYVCVLGVGLVAGACVGFLVCALCTASHDADAHLDVLATPNPERLE